MNNRSLQSHTPKPRDIARLEQGLLSFARAIAERRQEDHNVTATNHPKVCHQQLQQR